MNHRAFLPSAIAVCLSAFAVAAPVEITTPELRGAVQPQLAVSPSGRAAAVFGKGTAIYFTIDDGSLKFSAPVKVGELDKLALKMRRGPRVTMTDRLILITAISHADGNVHTWTSSDGGKSFKSGEPLNTVPGSAREGMMGLAGDGTGKVAAVWLDLREKGTQLWGRFSNDGGATWGADRVIYTSPDGHICECCHPSVAFAPNGEMVAMWRNWLQGSRDLYAISSKDLGRTFSAPQKLGEGTWKLNACPMDGGSVAAGPDGKWTAAWRCEGSLFENAFGTAEEKLAAQGKQPVIGFAGGSPVFVWEQGNSLQAKDASGAVKQLAPLGSAPSIVGGKTSVTVAYESGPGASNGLMVTRFP